MEQATYVQYILRFYEINTHERTHRSRYAVRTVPRIHGFPFLRNAIEGVREQCTVPPAAVTWSLDASHPTARRWAPSSSHSHILRTCFNIILSYISTFQVFRTQFMFPNYNFMPIRATWPPILFPFISLPQHLKKGTLLL